MIISNVANGFRYHPADMMDPGSAAPLPASFSSSSSTIALCRMAVKSNEGTKIRIADIDTPEVSEPKCSSEAALSAKATQRLLQLVNAGPFEMQSWQGRDEDKYGRKLRVIVRNGQSLGDILVSEGLARTWSGRREPWC